MTSFQEIIETTCNSNRRPSDPPKIKASAYSSEKIDKNGAIDVLWKVHFYLKSSISLISIGHT